MRALKSIGAVAVFLCVLLMLQTASFAANSVNIVQRDSYINKEDGKGNLRFITAVTLDEGKTVDRIGTWVVPKSIFNGWDNDNVVEIENDKVSTDDTVSGKTSFRFTADILNIPANLLNQEFYAKSYIVYSDTTAGITGKYLQAPLASENVNNSEETKKTDDPEDPANQPKYYASTPDTSAQSEENPDKTNANVDKSFVEFTKKFKNTDKYLYRVGNANTVKLSSLFELVSTETPSSVDVTVTKKAGNAGGTYTPKSTWENGEIQFSGTGVVEVAIKDSAATQYKCTLLLEVVDAINATSEMNATSNNVVLLDDVSTSSSTIEVSNGYALYGNGFTFTYTGDGRYLNNGLTYGVVNVGGGAVLDNLRVNCSIYPVAAMYYSQVQSECPQAPDTGDGRTRYLYQFSAVSVSGNSTISNCYIYGGRNNIYVGAGNITIEDSVLECGVVSNIQIKSSSEYTVTLDNVTTIQTQTTPTTWNDNNSLKNKVMLGFGVLVGPETTSNPKIVLKGDFKQYNWVSSEDASAVSNTYGSAAISNALKVEKYKHTIDGKVRANLGIVYLNTYSYNIEDQTGLPYSAGSISVLTFSGQVYSLSGATGEQIYYNSAEADRSTVNGIYRPQFEIDDNLGGQYIQNTNGCDEYCYEENGAVRVMFPQGESRQLDISGLVNIEKYGGQDLALSITCKDDNGNPVTVTDDKINLSEKKIYTVTYSVSDSMFFDKDGNSVSDNRHYSWDVRLYVSLKDNDTPKAEFEFIAANQKMGYYSGIKQYLPFLAGLKIYDYIGETRYTRFDGDNDFNKVAKIDVVCQTDGDHYAYVDVTLTDGGVISAKFLTRADRSGGSTYSGSVKTRTDNGKKVIYFVNGGTTGNKDSTTTKAEWDVQYYEFTGNNGEKITSAKQTFTSIGKSADTPSDNFNTKINQTVSYDANGGICNQTVGYATNNSTSVTLPKPSRSGYNFIGWYTEASGGTYVGVVGDSYTPTGNITLYAQWGNPCTVTYDANGGSCATPSQLYYETTLALPAATLDGYWMIGWFTEPEGGVKVGDEGGTFYPSEDITLYAHWKEAIEYTVTYDANGGTCDPDSAIYQWKPLTLPNPTRTGYTFNGWYTAASGGTKVGNAGEEYVPSADITLYAQWTINSYKVTIKTSNSSTAVTVNGATVLNGGPVVFDSVVKVVLSYSKTDNLTFTVKQGNTDVTCYSDEACTTSIQSTVAGTYYFKMPGGDVTINSSSSSCLAEGTLITLADGSQKAIEDLTFDDELLVWDFFKGEYTVSQPSLLMDDGFTGLDTIKLKFSDSSDLTIVYEHGLYDVNEKNYIYINKDNVDSYIGHTFIKTDGIENKTVELVDYDIIEEGVHSYTLLTAFHNNCIANGILTVTPPPVPGWYDYFAIGDDMKYDAQSMMLDIAKYGLYEYEDLSDYVSHEEFCAFNGPYLKVLVGKGLITYDDIIEQIGVFMDTNSRRTLD